MPRARNLCATHWTRWKKGLDLTAPVLRLGRTREERFWSKVDKSGECWTWTGATDAHGYGRFAGGGHTGGAIPAHRVSYELDNGPIPDGLHVCHRCDNPPCVRPDHLFLGTRLDNMRDMREKGRSPRTASNVGEKVWTAKLAASDVTVIRERYASGISARDIASEFAITADTVRNIASRRSWKHIP